MFIGRIFDFIKINIWIMEINSNQNRKNVYIRKLHGMLSTVRYALIKNRNSSISYNPVLI